MKILKILFVLSFIQVTIASNLDDRLQTYAARFNFAPVKIYGQKNQAIYELGEKLFFEKEISGNRNISCSTCHLPAAATSDALVLSIGQGGSGDANKRIVTDRHQIIARHSPVLFNLGHDDIDDMFWDGRISYSRDTGRYTTPEPGLNGEKPLYPEILALLDSPLAVQALFPITSHDEMRGYLGDNEFSDDSISNFELWNLVMKRLLAKKEYRELFRKAYGDITFNIGHYARALGHYQKFAFIVDKTPWDQYLSGNLEALSEKEKLGALTFVEKGMCANCHNGALLGGVGFFNVMSPQIGPGKEVDHDDTGLMMTTKNRRDAYRFKVPGLRNVALSAPYFHSGAYTTLSQVIEHYTKGDEAIDLYDSSVLIPFENGNYFESLFVEKDKYKILKKKITAHPLLQSKMIILTDEDKKLIELFLTKSLTQK